MLHCLELQKEEDKQVAKLSTEYKAWRDIYITLDSLINKLSNNNDPQIQDNLMAEYKKTVSIMVPISNTMGASMVDLIQTNLGVTLKMIDEAKSSANASVIITVAVVLLAILIAVVLTFVIVNSIINSLNKVKDGLGTFFKYVNRETNNIHI